MIPLKDENPSSTFPYVTVALIALNAVVFIYELVISQTPYAFEKFIFTAGAIPANITGSGSAADAAAAIAASPLPPVLTLFTSMFVHGGIAHIAGNMLYLWIFGDNIEDRFGKPLFILFYLASGVIAAFTHILADTTSDIPMVGASGAIAGVLGAYAVLFPHARVKTLLWIAFYVRVISLPAFALLIFWFVLQVLNSAGGGGVAWFAHIGGFVFGLVVAGVYRVAKGR